MSKISDLLNKLDDVKNAADEDAGRNKIYFLEVEEKPGSVKVGDTHRSVDERNQETMTNAALHRKKGTEPMYVLAEKHDGSTFRDKAFHAYLIDKGYEFELNDQGNRSEWVMNTTVDTMVAELAAFTAKPVRKQVQLRPAQRYTLELLQEARDEGYKYVNLGACVRIGKTVISLTHAVNNDSMPVYIGKNLTSQASAEADNNEFGIASEMLTQSLHGIDELEEGELSKKAKAIIANIDSANTNNKNIVFYIDEVDDASHTKRSRDIITPVVKHYESKGMLTQVIPMSGTRIYRGEKILKDLIAA